MRRSSKIAPAPDDAALDKARRYLGGGGNGNLAALPPPGPTNKPAPPPPPYEPPWLSKSVLMPIAAAPRTVPPSPPPPKAAPPSAAELVPPLAVGAPSPVMVPADDVQPTTTVAFEADGGGPQWLRVAVCTWNLHGKETPDDLSPWLRSSGDSGGGGSSSPVDLYAIGTQEAQRGIEASVLLPSKAKWLAKVTEALGAGYSCLGSQTLAAIHLVLFVRTALLARVTDVQVAHVATGIGGVVGNKGGVAVGLRATHDARVPVR